MSAQLRRPLQLALETLANEIHQERDRGAQGTVKGGGALERSQGPALETPNAEGTRSTGLREIGVCRPELRGQPTRGGV